MPDTHDPYREALVVETATVWPAEYDGWELPERARIERLLHAEPQAASHLDYIRTHTGFNRSITVTPDDIKRLK